MTHCIGRMAIFSLTAVLLTTTESFGATGSLTISSIDMDQPLCVTSPLVLSGTVLMEEDETPREDVVDSPYCNYSPEEHPAHYSPYIVLPMSNRTHAYLYYQIDGNDFRYLLKTILSSYLSGWSQIGETLGFYHAVSMKNLEPGMHTLTITFQDRFGVSCYSTRSRSYGYLRGQLGEIMDQQTLTFYIPEPGETECKMTATENMANPDPGSNCSNISVE